MFVDRFESAAQSMVTAANLIEDFPTRGDLAQQILECEHEGDRSGEQAIFVVNGQFRDVSSALHPSGGR